MTLANLKQLICEKNTVLKDPGYIYIYIYIYINAYQKINIKNQVHYRKNLIIPKKIRN